MMSNPYHLYRVGFTRNTRGPVECRDGVSRSQSRMGPVGLKIATHLHEVGIGSRWMLEKSIESVTVLSTYCPSRSERGAVLKVWRAEVIGSSAEAYPLDWI